MPDLAHSLLVKLRASSLIPVILANRVPRHDRGEEERQIWSRMMLILFKSWRTLHDLKEITESWNDAYNRQNQFISSTNKIIIRNMNVLSECRDARDEHLAALKRTKYKGHLLEIPLDMQLPDEGDVEDTIGDLNYEDTLQTAYDEFDSSDSFIEQVQQEDTELDTNIVHLVDNCYESSPYSYQPGMNENVSPEATTIAEEDVIQHQAVMKKLKAVRRPEVNLSNDLRGHHLSIVREAEISIENLPAMAESSTRAQKITRAMEQVANQMNLHDNPEQKKAFFIVGNHMRQGINQLLFYLSGVGGTGKSHVIKCILLLFTLLGIPNQILVGAPTGAAATLIGGHTIHALTFLPNKCKKDMTELPKLWKDVKYLIIDEVSMIGALFLSQISDRLKHATGIERPFGGINVIFAGDFGQLKPVRAKTLFSHELVQSIGTYQISSEHGVKSLTGAYLWRQVNHVVILRKNVRQTNDPCYSNLLLRVREGKCILTADQLSHFAHGPCPNVQMSDFSILRSRLLQNIMVQDPSILKGFSEAPIIVGKKSIRDSLNRRILCHKAKRLEREVHIYYAKDYMEKKPVDGALSEMLWKLNSTVTSDFLGKFPLFLGMKVMIQENVAIKHKVVNGATGTVHDIKYERDRNGRRYLTVVYVHIEGAGRLCPDLGCDIVPIFPETLSFKCNMVKNGRETTKSISRKQVPLLPAYVYTDYKSQGRSLEKAIIDIASAHSIQGVYVMLSRVKTLSGLAILRPFPQHKICQRLSQEMRNEFERLELIDRQTTQWYNSLPEFQRTMADNQDI